MENKPEISFVDGVPLLPNVRPVVVLNGSDYQMGYQYTRQLVQIFGTWILEIIHRSFSTDELESLKEYQHYIIKYAPEMIDIFKGMAKGAADAGIPLKFEEVLAQFTTTEKSGSPSPNKADKSRLLPPNTKCSGFAAWGTATRNGRMIASASSDGPDYFAVTLICFPEEGNSFIWSMYEAVDTYNRGGIPTMAGGGQPGLNDKGLVYVHHGNTQNASQMGRDIRYGLQNCTAIWHTLRFADNAGQAREMQLSYDCTGRGQEGTGGFWVDSNNNAFVIERMETPVVRKAGDFSEADFLYATNTLLSKELGAKGQEYIPYAGWTEANKPHSDSISRNLQLWHMLTEYRGKIDLDFIKMMWRFPGSSPPPDITPDTWAKSAEASYKSTMGAEWNCTISRISNAMVGIVMPDDKLYYIATGCVAGAPGIGSPEEIHWQRYLPFATRSFYQLKLASTPGEVTREARHQAEIDLYFANAELQKLQYSDPVYTPLNNTYNQAIVEWMKGDHYQVFASKASKDETAYHWAKAVRAFTRSQAFARQVYGVMVPPATRPEDLGLAPMPAILGDSV